MKQIVREKKHLTTEKRTHRKFLKQSAGCCFCDELIQFQRQFAMEPFSNAVRIAQFEKQELKYQIECNGWNLIFQLGCMYTAQNCLPGRKKINRSQFGVSPSIGHDRNKWKSKIIENEMEMVKIMSNNVWFKSNIYEIKIRHASMFWWHRRARTTNKQNSNPNACV